MSAGLTPVLEEAVSAGLTPVLEGAQCLQV